ncbi:hypothetical protein ESA94_08645 [Lacibacter luteus]|uniref:Uncharacterized protein n=1 Tax=Lacibacter luteus TaxID=2508719 RepID=A0A4Q1CJI2_9BACT|nr:hypothetical protein [Lacibacter luteus]RXK60527.1 hypothetical protein ESA94_08645 [Lacibacter luteus]
MKKIYSLLLAGIVTLTAANAQSVSVNTDGTAADNSSILDVKSTTKGMLVPRMTTAQRTAIIAPATGLLVFDTDTKTFWFYSGILWTNISIAGGGSFTLPYNGSTNSSTSALGVINTGNGAAIEGSGSAGAGVYGNSYNGAGVNALSTNGFGVFASSNNSTAIYGFGSNVFPTIKAVNSSGNAILGEATASGSSGLYGVSTIGGGYGVRGSNEAGIGIYGHTNTGTGVYASSTTGTALSTVSTAGGLAFNVIGKVRIAGTPTAPAAGYVLTSTDAQGNADWQPQAEATPKIAFRSYGVLSGEELEDLISGSSFLGEIDNQVYYKYENYDYGSGFDLNGSKFTVPVTGLYHFDAGLKYEENLLFDYTQIKISLMLIRDSKIYTMARSGSYMNSTENLQLNLSSDLLLQKGDVIWISTSHTNTLGLPSYLDIALDAQQYFNGHLVFKVN